MKNAEYEWDIEIFINIFGEKWVFHNFFEYFPDITSDKLIKNLRKKHRKLIKLLNKIAKKI